MPADPITPGATPYTPRVVREFRHLLAAAGSPRTDDLRRLRRIKAAARALVGMDQYAAGLARRALR